MDTALAKNLRDRRRAAGLSQVLLAQRTGLSQAWISRLESGTANPTVGTLSTLANALQVGLTELLAEQIE